MALTLNYSLVLQRIDADNGIRNIFDPSTEISIPDDIFGDTTLPIADGAVDTEIGLIAPAIDILAITTDVAITIKLNTIGGTPISIRADGTVLLDSENITALFVSNASGSVAHLRIIQAFRQE